MSASDGRTSDKNYSLSLRWAGYALGFSIGGFFDGILLHQILQWHHLLSGMQGGQSGDLRFQILADGLFHLLMYAVGLAGLFLLWRSRGEFAQSKADQLLIANALVGFGAWHVLDGLVSHWILGIHRIRMDSDMPLFWDLLWFIVFGIAFVVAGWLLRWTGGGTGRGHAPAALAVLAFLTGSAALLPPTGNSTVVVVFRPGIAPGEAILALASVQGTLVWSDASDQVWAVELPGNAPRLELYRRGALLVGGSVLSAGCIDWFRTG